MSDAEPLDLTRVLAEIDDEVAQRRASGDLPADLERELDRTFAQFAPVDAINADFDTIVAKIERSAVIDIRPPTASAYPGAAQMKQVVTKATAFYLRHVATQASGLFQAMARALRLLGERVDELERGRLAADAATWVVRPEAGQWSPTATDRWDEFLLEALAGVAGRVLHSHAGSGRLVRRLVDAGFDAYGVEPSEPAALEASDLVADIRTANVTAHLATLPADSLGAVVLSGCIDACPVPALAEISELVASRLVPGGVLALVSIHPGAWLRAGPPLAVDVAEGRPIHPETWQALLRHVGLSDPIIKLGAVRALASPLPSPSQNGEKASPGSDPPVADDLRRLVEAWDAKFARLAEAALGPEDFAVSARRRV